MFQCTGLIPSDRGAQEEFWCWLRPPVGSGGGGEPLEKGSGDGHGACQVWQGGELFGRGSGPRGWHGPVSLQEMLE